MKKITFALLALSLTTINLSAFEIDNPDSPECPTICHKTSLTPPGLGTICYETYLCFSYELNESTGKCKKIGENEMKIPVLCRDVPPAY